MREPPFSALRLTLACVVAATSLFACSKARAPGDALSAAPDVPLATARTGTIVERIDAFGRVGPPTGSTTKLAFAQAGTLRAVDVRVGDAVRLGDRIAELDLAPLAAPLAQARADALSASAGYGAGAVPDAAERGARAKLVVALDRLRALERGGPSSANGRTEAGAVARAAGLKTRSDVATLARETELFNAGVVARKDVDAARLQRDTDRAGEVVAESKVAVAESDYRAASVQARADVVGARSDVRSAAAQGGMLLGSAEAAAARVDAARVAYENGVLGSPADGIVLSVLKRPGEFVDPSSPVVEIGPAAERQVTLAMPAAAASRVAVGDVVSFVDTPAHLLPSSGRVSSIVPVVDRTTQVATIVVSGAPPNAVDGDAVNARIAIDRIAGIVVPASAIVEDPQTGKNVVFVRVARPKDGDSPFVMREIRVGASDAASAIVTAGLKAGERYATSGGYMLLAPPGG